MIHRRTSKIINSMKVLVVASMLSIFCVAASAQTKEVTISEFRLGLAGKLISSDG